MRVLVVSNLYPPYWVGGYEQIASWVVEGLQENGHDAAVLTGRGPAFAEQSQVHGCLDLDLEACSERYFAEGLAPGDGLVDGVRRHVFSLANLRACREVIRTVRPDLISCWNLSLISFSPLLAARQLGVPSLLHLSDTVANPFRNPHPPSFPERWRPLARWAVDRIVALGRPRRFIVPSEFLREKLVEVEGLAVSRSVVLHWPVEPTLSRRAVPTREAGPARRLLFVGNLIPEKGVDLLLQAFASVARARPQVTLTLVGEGPKAFVERLEALAGELPVRFAGRLDRAAVSEAYADHDALVFPSVWDEPFAVVPLEGLAMGLAVVASSAGGTPEAIQNGDNGLLVPPGDVPALEAALMRLTSEASLVAELRERGVRRAREEQGFGPFMERLVGIYRQAAGV